MTALARCNADATLDTTEPITDRLFELLEEFANCLESFDKNFPEFVFDPVQIDC